MPLASRWIQAEIILSEVSQTEKHKHQWHHLHVAYTIWHKWTYRWTKRLADIENRLWLPVGRDRGEMEWKPGLSRWKPWHTGFPRWLRGKEPACQHQRLEFDPWVRKIPWRREWLPIPVFFPGEFHGQKSLACLSPWGSKDRLTLSLFSKKYLLFTCIRFAREKKL